MNNFSISQLAQYSGLKPHTIRVWEQRYGALKPNRSEGNTRYYDDLQLRRPLNIVSLSAAGHRVSELCTMKDEQLFRLIHDKHVTEKVAEREFYISQLVSAALQYDEASFEKIFGHCLLRFSVRNTYLDIILPLLQRVGMLWSADAIPPATEHFISNLLRQKLFTAIDALPPSINPSSTWLCFLPEDEFHEIGLLFASYLIRLAGNKVIYLGSNVPLASLAEAVKATDSTHLITFLVKNNTQENTKEMIAVLSKKLLQKKIFICANEGLLQNVNTPKNIIKLNDIASLERELRL